MPVPPEHAARRVYHFTDLNNLKNLLSNGLLSCNEQRARGLSHKSIAENSIQERRSKMAVTCGPGGVVHDYVPLYFGKTSPMLLKQINAKNVDQFLIIYFVFPIAIVDRPDVVFTNAAANTLIPPTFFDDPQELKRLNWAAIDSTKWKSVEATKQARMAEVLVHRTLDPKQAAYLVVWNEGIAAEVRKIYASLSMVPPPIRFDGPGDGGYFFSNFRKELPDDMLRKTLASGPVATKKRYEAVGKEILSSRGKNSVARFKTPKALLAGLQADFSVLPETAELVGLESNNEVHTETVGDHTLRVVETARSLFQTGELSQDEQDLVELSAYLHDIGKGPKSRWSRCEGGKQQVDADHPIKSAGMLVRILTEEVKTITDDEVRVLCKLVCYHDLYGDIVGRDRRQDQLVAIADNARDLEMLITIGRADMSSVRETWGDNGDEQAAEIRDAVRAKLGGQ